MSNQEPVKIICSECGHGHYSRDPLTTKVRCEHCDHHIYSGDIVLDDGEEMTWVDRKLAYIPAPEPVEMTHCRECGTSLTPDATWPMWP